MNTIWIQISDYILFIRLNFNKNFTGMHLGSKLEAWKLGDMFWDSRMFFKPVYPPDLGW